MLYTIIPISLLDDAYEANIFVTYMYSVD